MTQGYIMEEKNPAHSIYDAAIRCGFDNCGIIPVGITDGSGIQ